MNIHSCFSSQEGYFGDDRGYRGRGSFSSRRGGRGSRGGGGRAYYDEEFSDRRR